jgi:hypothetical protein
MMRQIISLYNLIRAIKSCDKLTLFKCLAITSRSFGNNTVYPTIPFDNFYYSVNCNRAFYKIHTTFIQSAKRRLDDITILWHNNTSWELCFVLLHVRKQSQGIKNNNPRMSRIDLCVLTLHKILTLTILQRILLSKDI